MPLNKATGNMYPKNWESIATRIKKKHNYCCERCRHPNERKSGHVLTVHHLDMNKANCKDWNLAALCQRCHLNIQAKVRLHQGLFDFFIISDWFKPHLKGYLKDKALKENLRRIYP